MSVVLDPLGDGSGDPPLLERIGQHRPVDRVGDKAAFDEYCRAVGLAQHLEVVLFHAAVLGQERIADAELDGAGQPLAGLAAGVVVGFRAFGLDFVEAVAVDADENLGPPVVCHRRPPVQFIGGLAPSPVAPRVAAIITGLGAGFTPPAAHSSQSKTAGEGLSPAGGFIMTMGIQRKQLTPLVAGK